MRPHFEANLTNLVCYRAGTQDRVVLIQGTAEGLMKVQNTIIEKVYEFPVPKDLAAIIGDRPKQVSALFFGGDDLYV